MQLKSVKGVSVGVKGKYQSSLQPSPKYTDLGFLYVFQFSLLENSPLEKCPLNTVIEIKSLGRCFLFGWVFWVVF